MYFKENCLSPLIFKSCFNKFIQCIRQENYRQVGFSPRDDNTSLFQSVHWFQFADNATFATKIEREN